MRHTTYETYRPSALSEQEGWIGKVVGVAAMAVFAWGVVKLGIALANLGNALAHFQAIPKGF